MIDRSKLSPAGENTMVEIEAQLMELCEMLTAGVMRFRKQSRREQRRARKAAKNAHMWRTYGRRPWTHGSTHLDEAIQGAMTCEGDCPEWKCYCDVGDFVRVAHRMRLEHLREPSGFVLMSRVAEEMRNGK